MTAKSLVAEALELDAKGEANVSIPIASEHSICRVHMKSITSHSA